MDLQKRVGVFLLFSFCADGHMPIAFFHPKPPSHKIYVLTNITDNIL